MIYGQFLTDFTTLRRDSFHNFPLHLFALSFYVGDEKLTRGAILRQALKTTLRKKIFKK